MVSGLACAGVFVHGMGVVIAGQSLDALGCVHQRGRVVVVASGYHLCLRATRSSPFRDWASYCMCTGSFNFVFRV